MLLLIHIVGQVNRDACDHDQDEYEQADFPADRQERADQKKQSACHETDAADLMRFSPYFFIRERPRRAYADEVIKFKTRHVVSDDDEEHADDSGRDDRNVDFPPQTVQDGHAMNDQQDEQSDVRNCVNIFAEFLNVLLFRVDDAHDANERINENHDHRHQNQGKFFGSKIVRLSSSIPMNGHLFGQIRVTDCAHDDGGQHHKPGDDPFSHSNHSFLQH